MAWIDYQKAFDSVPHSWIIKSWQLIGINNKIISFTKKNHAPTYIREGNRNKRYRNTTWNIDILLTVRLSVFISVINQFDAQNLFQNKFYFMPVHVSSTCAHHQKVKIALHSLWYHHTETSEWSKIIKILFYKYKQIVVKFMCEFFGCDYCVLLTINMLCHVDVMFIQLLNLLESYYVYLNLCLP